MRPVLFLEKHRQTLRRPMNLSPYSQVKQVPSTEDALNRSHSQQNMPLSGYLAAWLWNQGKRSSSLPSHWPVPAPMKSCLDLHLPIPWGPFCGAEFSGVEEGTVQSWEMWHNTLKTSHKGLWRFSCRARETLPGPIQLGAVPWRDGFKRHSLEPETSKCSSTWVSASTAAELGQGMQLAPLWCASFPHNGRLTRSVFINTSRLLLLGSVPCRVGSSSQRWDIQSESPSEATV